ncbi:aminotransferase class I/II-fold pyridoxal phosphate-dependent enzyme [Pedobacter sp. HMF7647]|uniref:Aminotransferase class I/II-fold pyridoxal phosphate-dependent enzyme n=1 Tax=Hufsiella arboris TaxID=2695275 RepID=A0A7K1Y993_9SPHI|nr:aminotransferase class I/II-fold pyridoxal phosphate-dependent enzyme [Hufsiella arboris]MXV51173.1 aminotransferase class I/II-fold pyridoxal phosphate-dependent enzyme [Hufsiella arboris]
MVAPRNFLARATRLCKLIDRQGEHLLEEAIANLLKNGDIGRHLKKANKLYQERRDELCRLLNEHLSGYITFKVPTGGFAIWARYLHNLEPAAVSQKAAEMGLTIGSCPNYFHDRNFKHQFVRLGFASMNNKEMEEAVLILKRAIEKLI